MNPQDITIILAIVLGGAVALGLAVAVLVVAVKVTGGVISAIGWVVKQIACFIGGVVSDLVRFVGAVVTAVVAIPFATCNVVLGRWEAAGKWGRALKRETLLAGYSIWSAIVRRPLKLVCLGGLIEGVESRLPQNDAMRSNEVATAMERDFDRDRGSEGPMPRRSDPASFEGYTIEGTLRPGGSGAKLYIATPDAQRRRRMPSTIDKVVIKSFTLEEGSSLPQIVRESRALDAARSLGLVLDHGLDAGRFWYAMPFHPGENLNEMTRLLHARSGPQGIEGDDLRAAIGFGQDLVATLVRYHQGGLWHKDVKPDNIMVHDGRAHLVDLGLVTPLRSAMTLTTHGTEYFRDPEMVRQALRGVRVHQVDGGKFDVYGAGAVIYFMLENTFPAHGGLSSFAKRSPEALRWIVRRAMADYHQRYGSAEAMLQDLQAFAQAKDPWSVKPIELPSMRGADLHAAGDAAAAFVGAGVGVGAGFGGAAAGQPGGWMPPPRGNGAGFGMGMGGAGVGAAAIPVSPRPKLVVTNWWTGAYGFPGAVGPGRVNNVADATVAARAAVEAVKANRLKLKALNLKAKIRRDPPRLASAIGIMLLAVASILVFGKTFSSGSGWNSDNASAVESAVESAMAMLPPKALKAPAAGMKILVVNDHPTPANSEINELVDRVTKEYEARGFTVAREDTEVAAKVSLALAKERSGAGEASSARADVEAALATGGYFGGLHILADEGTGSPVERFRATPLGEQLVKAIADAKAAKSTKSKSTKTKRRSTVEVKTSSPLFKLLIAPTPPEAPIPAEPTAPVTPPEAPPSDISSGPI